MNILLVHDHPLNVAALEEVLAPLGAVLVEASTSAEAVAIAATEDFALVLLDLQLPELDGLETAGLLKRIEHAASVPIIILTAHEPSRAMMAKGYASGAVDFLTKPVDPEVLRSKVAAFVSQYRERRERASGASLPVAEPSTPTVDVMLYEDAETARKRAELAEIELRASESRLRLALESAGIGTWDYNPITGALRWDAQTMALFGLASGSTVDYHRLLELTHPDDRDRLDGAVRYALASHEESFECDFRAITPGGDERWISSRGQVIVEQGRAVRFTGTHVDITVKKRVEEERVALLARERAARNDAEQARARAEAASRAKDEFLATVSHELRNPLNAILGWSRVLVEEEQFGSNERLSKGLDVILRNAKAQVQLVEDILEVSRIVTGKLRLQTGVMDVRGAVEAAIETVRAAAQAKNVTLEARLGERLGSIVADADRVQQVLWNLLSNAVKFTPRGGVVTVEVLRDEEVVALSVVDTGEGIAPDFLPFVFERFRQADGSTTRRHGGLGLGLAIVRHLVELHGGTVSAESEGPGSGATFQVLLPLHASASLEQEQVIACDSEPSLPIRPPMPLLGKRVLVLDDEADMRDLIAVILETAGATVTRVPTVAAAVEMLTSEAFDVALSDLAMPGEDGYAFVRRALERGVRVPLVAMTAYARAEDRHRVLAAGFRRHVAKPIEPAELVDVLAELMRKAQRARA